MPCSMDFSTYARLFSKDFEISIGVVWVQWTVKQCILIKTRVEGRLSFSDWRRLQNFK